jgi:hypothetical protein
VGDTVEVWSCLGSRGVNVGLGNKLILRGASAEREEKLSVFTGLLDFCVDLCVCGVCRYRGREFNNNFAFDTSGLIRFDAGYI